MSIPSLVTRSMISFLLVLAALSDLRKRVVPPASGWGLLLLGLASLIWNGHWMVAGFTLFGILGSRGGAWSLLPVLAGTVLILPSQLDLLAGPFVMSILFVNLMFEFEMIGGGDAQLAYSLLAISYGDYLWMPVALLGTTLLGLIPIFWKRGLVRGFKRAGWIIRNFDDFSNDEEAIVFPWAVIAAVVGLVYVWKDIGRLV